MNRRDFILLAAGSVAQFASAGSRVPTVQCAGGKGERPLVRFGVVTDPHFGDLESTMPPGEVRAFRESDAKMREFVEVMNSRSVDFVVDEIFVGNNALKIRYIGFICLYDILFQGVSCDFDS